MGSSRPKHIDLGGAQKFDPNRLGGPSPRDLPSPRSGEVPPALSPLDAFAFHSSILARKFEEENDGRRISRLPPLAIAQELSKRKQFAAAGQVSVDGDRARDNSSGGSEPLYENANDPKHRSYYPFVSTFDDAASITETIEEEPEEEEKALKDADPTVRSSSPESIASHANSIASRPEWARSAQATQSPRQHDSGDLVKRTLLVPYTDATDATRRHAPNSLAPPRSPTSNRPRSPQPSIRPVRNDSGDDNSDALSFLSDPNDLGRHDRKMSATTVSSRPRSPYSPVPPHARSPSVASERSFTSLPPRKSQNFSRPMSPAIKQFDSLTRPSIDHSNQLLAPDSPALRPSFDVLSLNESISDSHNAVPPSAINGLGHGNESDAASLSDASTRNPAASYIYAKYSLPRGRTVERNSLIPEDFFAHRFEWEAPQIESNVVRLPPEDPPSAAKSNVPAPRQPSRPNEEIGSLGGLAAPSLPKASASMTDVSSLLPPTAVKTQSHSRRPSADQLIGKRSIDALVPPSLPRLSNDRRSSGSRKSSFSSKLSKLGAGHVADDAKSKPSDIDSDGTRLSLDPRTLSRKLESTTTPTPDQITPDAHLAIGIECHENGSLQKSTYHLRVAARGGQPTAMLLYAMACRHGWGMRPNPTEAVTWLRKAVDTAGLEVADDEAVLNRLSRLPNGVESDYLTRKTHKAQLALAIYELGVSYLNGWGIAQDKTQALRCFEISGGWGDADALAEAGFCYAKGVGCKKNLMKAAALYRQAAEKGISMTGNSWIYKDKYLPKEPTDERQSRTSDREKERKPRDKSRSRSIFGGKKKSQQQPPVP